MKSTFQNTDCIYLLKDLTGIIDFPPFEESIKAGAEAILVSHNIVKCILMS